MSHTAIVRVDQLYPFPMKDLQRLLSKYRQARDIVWVQEEPKNRGAWAFLEPRLRELMSDTTVLSYVGREESASPATGSYKMHVIEEKELIAQALEISPKAAPVGQPAAATSPTPVSD